MTPKEVRAAWAARLEANPDRQGRSCLAPSAAKRCCLGELCDMAVEAGVIECYKAAAGLPPVAATQWAGLRKSWGPYWPSADRDGAPVSLAADNDCGKSWPEIAEIIRAEPDGLVFE